jgi:hypothetical protein
MRHAEKADKLLIKSAAGARPAPPHTRGKIIPKAHTKQPVTRRVTRGYDDNQAGNSPDRPRRRVLPSPEERPEDRYGGAMAWFGVRHVIKNEDAYEERITGREAHSHDDAIARAEAEAADYAWEGTEPLSLYQSFELVGPPQDGAEVFSLIRRSELPPDRYLDSFFSTGSELQQTTDS